MKKQYTLLFILMALIVGIFGQLSMVNFTPSAHDQINTLAVEGLIPDLPEGDGPIVIPVDTEQTESNTLAVEGLIPDLPVGDGLIVTPVDTEQTENNTLTLEIGTPDLPEGISAPSSTLTDDVALPLVPEGSSATNQLS